MASLKSEGSAVTFEKEATKEEALDKLSNNGVLKTRLSQSLFDTSSSRKRTV